MRTLILLRHAKSSWNDDVLSDHDRPLAPRGRRDAPAVATRLRDLELLPDQVISSTAARTRETVALAAEALGSPPIDFDASLYLADPAEILRAIRETPPEVETLIVVGHNPGTHDIALALCDRGRSSDHLQLESGFPTAAAAVITFDLDRWSDVRPGIGSLVHFIRPRDLSGPAGHTRS
ncbi:MAG: histidine phosphatase family protein [Longimicrobiales bacterium]|nr:histidine phosphatase family protein [Longimicrobiales bacterium]